MAYDDEGLQGVTTDEEDLFGSAASYLAAAVTSKDGRFNDNLKLQFYGLYKQATAGKCSGGRPGIWDQAGRRKWDAWAQLGDLPKTEAMSQYVEFLRRVAPEWDEGSASTSQLKSKSGMGPVFSCLAGSAEAGSSGEEAGPRTLHEIAGAGDVEELARMLDAGEPIDNRDDTGCTALHFAADRGSIEAARLLISAGADINAQDADGQTPMHYACITENREVYDLLAAAGADSSIRDSQGATAAEVAPAAWGL